LEGEPLLYSEPKHLAEILKELDISELKKLEEKNRKGSKNLGF